MNGNPISHYIKKKNEKNGENLSLLSNQKKKIYKQPTMLAIAQYTQKREKIA